MLRVLLLLVLACCSVTKANNTTDSLPPLSNFRSIHINQTHDLGLMLNNETYHLLLPESILGNASYLDALTEDDLKYLNESDADAIDEDDDYEEVDDELDDVEDEEDSTTGNDEESTTGDEGNSTTGEDENAVGVENDEENIVEEVIEENHQLQINPDDIRAKKCPACQCGIRNARRIVGGKVTPKYMYPWTVVLRLNGRFYCGGALITDRHVITAGHCTEGVSVRKISAGFLHHDLRNPERGVAFSRNVASYKRHGNYNSRTLEHDIAILTLSRRVPIGSAMLRTVCLPGVRKSYAGRKGIIAGWGAVGEFSMPSAKLRQAVVPILSNQRCKRTVYGNEIKKSMMCAGYPKRGGIDACQGDSGGPLMIAQNKRFYLAGVISWGDGCAARNRPGVYTRVTRYLRWIRNRASNGCWCNN